MSINRTADLPGKHDDLRSLTGQTGTDWDHPSYGIVVYPYYCIAAGVPGGLVGFRRAY